MNVLFYYNVTINSRFGGIAHVTYYLGEYFKSIGWNVFFLSVNRTSDDQVDYQYYLPNGRNKQAFINEIFFLDFVRKNNISVVINQNGINPCSNEILYWGKKANVTIITVLHNSLVGMYGMANHLQKLTPIITKLRLTYIVQKILLRFFQIKYQEYYRQQVILSDKIVLLSDKFFPEYKYFAGETFNKIISIPNPVTIPIEDIVPKKEKEVLFVGRLVKEKGVDRLLSIWKKIYKKHLDWNLIIVGDGKERMTLEDLSAKMKLENVSFEGFQSPEKYYKRASIFCMVSSFEGFGLVLVEAMANAVVPLAFNSYANVSDIIDDGVNGYLVTPFCLDEYATKLSTLMDDVELRNLISKRAKEKSNVFSMEVIGRQWQKLLS